MSSECAPCVLTVLRNTRTAAQARLPSAVPLLQVPEGTGALRGSPTFHVSFAVPKARLTADTAATTDSGAGQAAPEAAL